MNKKNMLNKKRVKSGIFSINKGLCTFEFFVFYLLVAVGGMSVVSSESYAAPAHQRVPTRDDFNAYFNYLMFDVPSKVFIFVERPHRVYDFSVLDGSPQFVGDKAEMRLRMIEATIFKLFTHDLSCHAGIIIKDRGRMYQVHADILITKRNIADRKFLLAAYDLYDPHLTHAQEEELITNIHKYVREGNSADIAGVFTVWKNRYRSVQDRADANYARNYYAHKKGLAVATPVSSDLDSVYNGAGSNVNQFGLMASQAASQASVTAGINQLVLTPVVPTAPAKFICTELVATAFGSIGIDLAPKLRFNKLYPLDVVKNKDINFTKIVFKEWFEHHRIRV